VFDHDILILRGSEISSLLENREAEIIDTVQSAYETHARGASSLPLSNFLRFPGENPNRIIALPAYLGGDFQTAGIKWVSSFTGNLEQGLDRASAVMILNSTETGRPQAILEGSIISAKRTAASAALAARTIRQNRETTTAGIIGCGVINFQIVQFLLTACPRINRLVVFDLAPSRVQHFKTNCEQRFDGLTVEIAVDISAVLSMCHVVSFATTAGAPHIFDLSPCAPGTTILHISLRDLAPELILANDNVVDDIEHVCQAQTSVHLAEQLVGGRDFIRCTLADILMSNAPATTNPESIGIFSPFGMGVLDLALGKLTYEQGRQEGMGTVVNSFLPPSWAGKESAAHQTAG
jgi:2,3-diaminopropionate biosynthesis protein SbnB